MARQYEIIDYVILKCINYLGPVFFKSLPIDVKKSIFNDKINIKNV